MAVALTPDAYLSRATTAWDVYFSWCGWRRISVDRDAFTVLAYLGNDGLSGGFQVTADGTQLVVFDVSDFTDLLGGTGPDLGVGTWWFFGITTIAADIADNVVVYYAPRGAGALTAVTASYGGQYQYTRHFVGARPGADGSTGAFRLHGAAAHDRSWENTTLTPAEMFAEFQSETPVKAGAWSSWPMVDVSTAGSDASGNARPLTVTPGTGSVATTDGPFDGEVSAAVDLDGGSGTYVSTPSVALDIFTDGMDLRVEAAALDWTPGAAQTLVSQWVATGNQRSFRFDVAADGRPTLVWSVDGTVAGIVSAVAVDAPDLMAGERVAWRAVLDGDNGVGQHTVTFYVADTVAGPWTPLGPAVTQAGVTAVFASTAPLALGAHDNGTGQRFVGWAYAAEIRNTSGQLVGDPDFTDQPPSATSVTDGSGRVWTLEGTAALVRQRTSVAWSPADVRRFQKWQLSNDGADGTQATDVTVADSEGHFRAVAGSGVDTSNLREVYALRDVAQTDGAGHTVVVCGPAFTGNIRPQHGLAFRVQEDGGRNRAIIVWHDIAFAQPQIINAGVWSCLSEDGSGFLNRQFNQALDIIRSYSTTSIRRENNIATLVMLSSVEDLVAGDLITVVASDPSFNVTNALVTGVSAFFNEVTYANPGPDVPIGTVTVTSMTRVFPYSLEARVEGTTVEVRAWGRTQTPPAWGDPARSYTVDLNTDAAGTAAERAANPTPLGPGQPGLVVAHLGTNPQSEVVYGGSSFTTLDAVFDDGTVPIAAFAAGTLGIAAALAGSSPIAAHADGALTVSHLLEGPAPASASSRGSLAVARPLAGATAAATHATGSLSVAVGLSGHAPAAASAAGSLDVARPLAGVAPVSGDSVGALAVSRALDGAAPVAAQARADLTTIEELGGSAGVAAAFVGSLTVNRPLRGRSDVAAALAGDLDVARTLGGLCPQSCHAAGSLTVDRPLRGRSDVAAALAGDLDVARALAGSVAAATSADGSLAVARHLSGIATGAAMAVGRMTLEELMEGIAPTSATVLGTLKAIIHPLCVTVREGALSAPKISYVKGAESPPISGRLLDNSGKLIDLTDLAFTVKIGHLGTAALLTKTSGIERIATTEDCTSCSNLTITWDAGELDVLDVGRYWMQIDGRDGTNRDRIWQTPFSITRAIV